MLFYKPKHFDVKELVDKQTYRDRGEKALELLNADMLCTLDYLRERYQKPIYVNNWDSGGDLQFRGFRPRACLVGAPYSQHRLGAGFDLTVAGMTAEQVRDDIRRNPDDSDFSFIKAVELDVSWVHIDARNIPENKRILWIKP